MPMVGVTMAGVREAAITNAIRASGVLVRVNPEEFQRIVKGQPEPLVVYAARGYFKKSYQYLTSYKGLAFFANSPEPLKLHAGVELICAGLINIPG